MVELDYRHAHLLKGLVEEYIATGKPVGSEKLLEVLDVSVSSATVRSVLRDLEEEGYVTQPHTSAGRIPTDKGYRYYVDNLSFKEPTERRVREIEDTYRVYQEEYTHPARAAAKLLAQFTHSVAMGGWMDSNDMYASGMSQLLGEDQEDSRQTAREVSHFFDNMEQYAPEFADTATRGVQVYIGQENPFFVSPHTSMVIQTVQLPTGEIALLLIAGPKRMPYRKNVALLSALASILEKT